MPGIKSADEFRGNRDALDSLTKAHEPFKLSIQKIKFQIFYWDINWNEWKIVDTERCSAMFCYRQIEKKHFLSLKSHKKEWEENFSDIKIINLLTFSLSLSPSHIYSRSTYFPHIKWNGVETKSSCFSSVTFSVCDVNIVRWFELIDVLLVRRYFFLVWINDTVSVIAVWRRRVCLCRDLFSGASKSFCNHKTVDSITKWENLGSSIAITYHKCRINVETAETLIS